jgi:hypothetical protein
MQQNTNLYSNVPFGISAELQKLTHAPFAVKMGRNKQGEIYVKPNLFNISQFLRHLPDFAGRIKWDAFASKVMTTLYQDDDETGTWEDEHALRIKHHCIDLYDCDFSIADIHAAAFMVAKENPDNSLLTYLDMLTWDGVLRLDKMLHDYFGVEDNELTRAYSRKTLIAACARAFATKNKLVKHDAMLVIYGRQGLKKSTALQALCLEKEFDTRYFGDTPIDIKSKDAILTIQGKLIYEMKELAKRSKDKTIEKAWIDHKKDDVRFPYTRANVTIPRKCIFIATTNENQILTDSTGHRRFWCVEAGKDWNENRCIDVDQLREDADQLFAEAMFYYKKYKETREAKYNWWLNKEQEQLQKQDAENYTQDHPLTDAVIDAIENLHVEHEQGEYYTAKPTTAQIIEDLYREKNPLKETTKYLEKSTRLNQVIISDILTAKGYTYKRKYIRIGFDFEKKPVQVRGWFK